MSAYLAGLFSVSALVGVCSYISYGERQDKCLKAASSLILVYVLISPVITLMKNAADYQIYDDSITDSIGSIEDSAIAEKGEEAFSKGIKKYVCESFSLSEDEIEVNVVDFDFSNMRARKIKIILYGKAIFSDSRRIAEEITKNGLGECEVELSVK